MSYVGDFALGSTFDIKFTTVDTAGAPTTLSGTPAISAYPDNSVTEITAGITLSADFDSRTGLNNVRVVATSGNGYAAGSNYQLVITTGTVDGGSVVGYVVAQFSIEARSALRPTTAGRTLDVSATGEAGLDWANVGSPTTTVGLSGTTIKTATDVETDTADIQSRLPAALVSGRMSSDAVAISGSTAAADSVEANIGNLDAPLSTIDTNVDSILDDTGTSGVVVATASKTGYALSAAGIQAIWDALTSALTTVGSIGKLLVDNINATVSSRSSHSAADVWAVATRVLTAGTNIALAKGTGVTGFNDLSASDVRTAVGLAAANLDTQLGTIDTNVSSILTDTGTTLPAQISALNNLSAAQVNAEVDTALSDVGLTTTITGRIDAAISTRSTVTTAQVNAEVVDALTVDVIADSVAADGSRPTIAQALLMVMRFLTEKSVSGTTVTVKKEDGTTQSMTFTLDDATTPTSITRSS